MPPRPDRWLRSRSLWRPAWSSSASPSPCSSIRGSWPSCKVGQARRRPPATRGTIFAGGTYLFDPLTERLVQLFPDAFWFETSILLAGVIVVLAIGVRLIARRRAGGSPGGFAGPTPLPVERAR